MDWNDFYNKKVNSTYQIYFERRYKPFLDAIIASHPSEIIEGGCGIGSISKYFTRYGVNCTGFDLDSDMVRLANLNCPKARFYWDDLLSSPANIDKRFLVTHGVLEHLFNFEIESILNKYPNSIHYVPTDKYTTQTFGDERLLSREFWEDTFNIKEVNTFNQGYDLMFKSNY